MKRNTALFGASLVAGVVAAAGLVATSTTSSAAGTYYGVNWADHTNGTGSGGKWVTGAYGNSSTGDFWGSASAGKYTFQTVVGSQVRVSVACVGTSTVTTVIGGGAPGVYRAGQSVTLAEFIGAPGAIGNVTFGHASGGHTAGAYIDLSRAFGGSFVALDGVDCAAATSTTSTSTSTSPTTSPTTTSSSTTSPTSTSTSSSTTSPTSSPSSSTTPPPTTEPPTPTPTTTTLPVTG